MFIVKDVSVQDELHQRDCFKLFRIRDSTVHITDVGFEVELLLNWTLDEAMGPEF